MIDFSKQIEDLRKEITEAIIGLLRRHGLTGLEFPESGTVPNAPDSVYVIFLTMTETRLSASSKSFGNG